MEQDHSWFEFHLKEHVTPHYNTSSKLIRVSHEKIKKINREIEKDHHHFRCS